MLVDNKDLVVILIAASVSRRRLSHAESHEAHNHELADHLVVNGGVRLVVREPLVPAVNQGLEYNLLGAGSMTIILSMSWCEHACRLPQQYY